MTDREFGQLLTRVEILEREMHKIREWRHDMSNELIAPIQAELMTITGLLKEIRAREDGRPRTRDDGRTDALSSTWFYRLVTAFAAGAGVSAWALLHFH